MSTGQGFIGYNMFAYCLNNPVNQLDITGICSYNSVTGKYDDCDRIDCPNSSNYIPYTVSLGGMFGIGIGPLGISLQIALVTDSEGASELQISYSSPNILSTGLPSVDEMLADISAENPQYKFSLSCAGTVTITNAPSVSDLHGPTFSVGGAVAGAAADYNIIPVGNEIYSGFTFAGGMITPGFNINMSNTVLGIPVPFSVFDIIEAMNEGFYGR